MKNLKDKLVLNMVRVETGLQFFLLKHKVDWNGRYETPAGKAWHGRPAGAPRRLPPARGKRVPEVEINVPILQTHKQKTAGKQILSSL
ncbi:hypothetical protein KEH51_01840 [[Brevibacterium] frigoritolerans]|uniref:Uncharacterized protein n=1 Tax=Peribacillus frigoritolerans TaxID=450367 RepID=A0A941FJI4_9BACI|nr:hypothetical protein [Peribacillus frigoritolerans]